MNYHGPENAEHEIRKAYNCLIESGVTFSWDRILPSGVHPHELASLYQAAFKAHRDGNKLAAERWARSAKHLYRAFASEAKLAYLEATVTEIPFLNGAEPEEYDLHYQIDTTMDLLNSVADHIPPGISEMPENMRKYLVAARKHLERLTDSEYKNELLRAERIKAAHEYGRVMECLALAYEANPSHLAA